MSQSRVGALNADNGGFLRQAEHRTQRVSGPEPVCREHAESNVLAAWNRIELGLEALSFQIFRQQEPAPTIDDARDAECQRMAFFMSGRPAQSDLAVWSPLESR